MRVIFFDTETTGIKETDRIVQFAMKERGTTGGKKALFKPPVPLTPDAMSVNHITNEMVENAPAFIGSPMHAEILELAADPEVVFCAHNAPFDLKMLAREGVHLPRLICTLKLAHFFDKEGKLEKHNLQYLRYLYGINIQVVAHDALGDVLVLEKVFEVLWQQAIDRYGVERGLAGSGDVIDKLMKITARPILLKKWPRFGKHKEKPFALIPTDYLRWAQENIDMDENLAYTVGRWIIHNEKLAGEVPA